VDQGDEHPGTCRGDRMLAAALCTAAWPAAQCRLTARPGTEVRPAVIAAWRATTPPP